MIGEPVGVIRAGTTVDRYENVVTVYGTEVDFIIDGCAFDPGGSTEIHDGRTAVVTLPTVYAPPGADLLATDRLVVRGRPYDVTGTPAVWVNPYSATEKGVVVQLEEVTG